MDTITPEAYLAAPWWQVFATRMAGRPSTTLDRRKLEALIAGRRAAASARMKAMRWRSERGIARLITHGGL